MAQGHESVMRVQWVLRLLDFFAVSMVIPTMAQFFTSAGGSAADYYFALIATTGVQLVANFVVGAVVDKHLISVKALYVPLCVCSILGSGLYAAADAVEAIRSPRTILMSRMLTGLGTGKSTLVFIMMAQLIPEAEERSSWLVAMSTARSLGLFVGPGLAVVLTTLSGGIQGDHGGSAFGAFALPGIFLGVANAAALVWLMSVLKEASAPATPGSSSAQVSRVVTYSMSSKSSSPSKGHMSLGQFFRCRHVLAVCSTSIFGIGTAPAIEYVIPVMCANVLPWGAQGSGAILMCISIAVAMSQGVVMLLQRSEKPAIKRHLSDLNLVILGSCGVSGTLALAVGVWACVIGKGPGAALAANAHAVLVAAPFVLAEMWFPYLGNGSNMLFTRLVLTHVPGNMGICQALITTNGPILGQMLLTSWLGATYSGEMVQREGAPQTALLGIAVLNCVSCFSMFLCYDSLRPRGAYSVESGSPVAITLVRTQSPFFGNSEVPITPKQLDEAEEILERSMSEEGAVDARPLLNS